LKSPGVGAAVLLAGLLCSGCGAGDMAAAPAQVSQAVDSLLQSAELGTWSTTYDGMTTAGLRQNFPKEAYDRLGRGIHDRLGKLVSKSTKSFFVRSMNGVVSVDAIYEAQFDRGKGTVRTNLIKIDGSWRFHGLWLSSPEFLDAFGVPCASCGKPCPKDAAFCPGCGKKIDPVPAAPTKQ